MDQNSATYEGQKMYDPKGWWDTYVFSQDHKVIALQYVCVALAIGLTGMFLSLLMRMQLGFPGLSLIHISEPTRLLSSAVAGLWL